MLIALFCLLQPPAPNLKLLLLFSDKKLYIFHLMTIEREWCHAHFLVKYLVSTPLYNSPSQFICCLVNRLWNAFLLDDELMSQAVICTVPPILILLRINNSPSPSLYCHAPILLFHVWWYCYVWWLSDDVLCSTQREKRKFFLFVWTVQLFLMCFCIEMSITSKYTGKKQLLCSVV